MGKKGRGRKKGEYNYLLMLAVVVTTWGVVPGFAKLSNLGGDITTFYVNWIAVVAVATIITAIKGWQQLKEYSYRDYATMALLGIAWPLVYSVAYFGAVQVGGPALTTILNYTWPVFALIFAYVLNRAQATWVSMVSVIFAATAVGVTCFFESRVGVGLSLMALSLGTVAAVTQGFYSSATDRWKYDPWTMTFVVELVTAVGVTLFVVARGSFIFPDLQSLAYLTVIGAISNGIGFWAFLAGSQSSGNAGMNAKCTWLIGMCLVPFAQVILLPILGVEQISVWKWVGVALVASSLAAHRIGSLLIKKKVEPPPSWMRHIT
ncbi:MAG: DMT family transporter [bacterium]